MIRCRARRETGGDLPASEPFDVQLLDDFLSGEGDQAPAIDPHDMGGQACIRGMRVPVSLIVNLVCKPGPHPLGWQSP
jgi:hypothetical protein